MGEGQDKGVPQKWAGFKGDGLQLVESTLGVNPESATSEFLRTAKNLGFNRLSFGIQSLPDAELQSVGRIHTAAQAINAIKLAQQTGFQNISADLIIGLPGQNWNSLHSSLEALTGLGFPHLSIYCLSLETGTPLALDPPTDLPSDDVQAELFAQARAFLLDKGLIHYEISNFACPGFECLHNLNYWRGGEYLGLGPAAASHINNPRFKNKNDLDAYLQNPTGQIEYVEELSPKDKAAEEAMLRLRLLEEAWIQMISPLNSARPTLRKSSAASTGWRRKACCLKPGLYTASAPTISSPPTLSSPASSQMIFHHHPDLLSIKDNGISRYYLITAEGCSWKGWVRRTRE